MAQEPDERPPWRRPITIVFALGVAAIPTIYALFAPELEDDPLWVRALVLVAWLLIAFITIRLATRREAEQEEQLDQLTRDREEEQQERLWRAFDGAFDVLLSRPRGVPESYEFTMYTSPDGENLVPAWPQDPETEAVKTFASGNGATGEAWEREETILVDEDAVSDATHGLRPAQREFFRGYRAVVAEPVLDRDGVITAVLTAISKPNDRFFETSAGKERIRDLAAVVGPLVGSLAEE
jgi:hypothetical protein